MEFAAKLRAEGWAKANTGEAVTVAQAMNRWLLHVREDLSPTTWNEYRRLADKRIIPALGQVELRKLETSAVNDFYRSIDKARTAQLCHSVLSGCMKYAVEERMVRDNAVKRARKPRKAPVEMVCPTVEEVEKLIANGGWLAPIIELVSRTGLRRGEVCALRWSDIGEKHILVSRAVIVDGTKLVVKSTKTEKGRSVPVGAKTLALLADLPRTGEYVFGGNRPVHPPTVSGTFAPLTRSLNIKCRFHDLRHFFATQALSHGIPVKTVSVILGHANAAITLGVYAHAIPADDDKAAQVMEDLF